MFVPEFRKAAMESADAYLKYLLETDKGIVEIPVKKVDIAFPYVYLYLRGSLPAVDLELFSIYIYGDKFDLRRFSPQDYDEKARCISLTPGEKQLHYFSAPPAHIKIISDFRFLVQRVFFEWRNASFASFRSRCFAASPLFAFRRSSVRRAIRSIPRRSDFSVLLCLGRSRNREDLLRFG